MSEITYHQTTDCRILSIRVYSGGLRVGTIRAVEGGFRYFPKGSKVGGEVFTTIAAVKQSLES